VLKYTGHPFIDIGIAAITAFANKRHPEQLTPNDLEAVATYIEKNYVRPPLRGFLTMVFTTNAWFIQDQYNPDKAGLSSEQRAARQAARADWAARHLRQWQSASASDERCVFTGEPAIMTNLSKKLPVGRVGRAQLPLLQGDDAINFFTSGEPGLPISGNALLALQFFPMGCAKADLGLLAVHSDNEQVTYELVWSFLKHNIEEVSKAQVTGEDKLPGSQRSLKTLLIEALLDAEHRQNRAERREHPASLTAYNYNNGKTPGLTLYHLPLEITGFIVSARANYQDAWNQLVGRAWQLPPSAKSGDRPDGSADQFQPRRNFLYEDLFNLPTYAPQFIRRYFLRTRYRARFQDDPRSDYSLRKEVSLVSWQLVELFLRKVVLMDAEMISRIRNVGDRLAEYIENTGDKRFFRGIRIAKDYTQFRMLLIYKLEKAAKQGVLLVDYDEYVNIFEDANESIPGGWRLARDLLLIRIIDQLYQKNKISEVVDELEDDQEPVEE